MQSNDYKPGVSGWRFEKDVLYINRAALGSASAVPEPQMIEIEVFNHRQDELPTTPGALVRLITDAQGDAYKAGAQGDGAVQLEFYVETIDPEYPTPRLRMYFRRLENIDELCARLKRAASQGSSSRLVNGVLEILHDGVVRMRLGNLAEEADNREAADQAAAESIAAVAKAADAGTHSATESMQSPWAIQLKVNEAGQYVCGGFGIAVTASELRSDILIKAERIEILPDGIVRIKQSAFSRGL